MGSQGSLESGAKAYMRGSRSPAAWARSPRENRWRSLVKGGRKPGDPGADLEVQALGDSAGRVDRESV